MEDVKLCNGMWLLRADSFIGVNISHYFPIIAWEKYSIKDGQLMPYIVVNNKVLSLGHINWDTPTTINYVLHDDFNSDMDRIVNKYYKCIIKKNGITLHNSSTYL